MESAPVNPPAEGDAPVIPPTPENPQALLNQGSALLTVSVPAEAKVFVNGRATRSTGERRSYVSRGLSRGSDYTYEVRAEIQRDGETVRETKIVNMRAGQDAQVAFNFEATQPVAEETILTLVVPEDAKVYLAGAETRATGAVRSFRTSRLAEGETWNDYNIRVTLKRDGRTLSKERTITLLGGESREVTFDFSADRVASNR